MVEERRTSDRPKRFLEMPTSTNLELHNNEAEQPGETGCSEDLQQSLQAAAQRWLSDPVAAFSAWKCAQRVHGTEFEEHSVAQYVSMWGRYCAWLRTQKLKLDQVGAADVESFLVGLRGGRLADKPAAASTKRRYLFLLHRTYEHLLHLGAVPRNPAAELPELARHQAHERPGRTMLREDQEQAYITWCMAQPAKRWDQLRNRALRLLFLGSGITVYEARMLRLDDVTLPPDDPAYGQFATLQIHAHGNTLARQAPVSEFAVQPLQDWIIARHPLGSAGDALFPAGRTHPTASVIEPEQGHLRPSASALSSEEVYDIVSTAMRGCGFDGHRSGPATLRNTYMARQIRNGRPLEDIRDWVGLATTEQLRALRRQVPRRLGCAAPA